LNPSPYHLFKDIFSFNGKLLKRNIRIQKCIFSKQLFCYTRITWAIWENFNNKKISSSAESGNAGTGNGVAGGWRSFLARCRRIGRPTGQVKKSGNL